jgi:(p)ppGpp synthase/HD superfamily hydrolase
VRHLAQTYPQFAVELNSAGRSAAELAQIRAAYDLASSLFAGTLRGSGKPFLDHLVGTASGVLLGGGSSDALAAALLHAAYDEGDFGFLRTGATARNRRCVAGSIGDHAEDLVHRYHRLRWSPDAVAAVAAGLGAAGEADRSVLLIRIANELDDIADGGLTLSGKTRLAVHAPHVHETILSLAGVVGTAEFAALARQELFAEPPGFPPELIVGSIRSSRHTPRSARPRVVLRLVGAAGRVRLGLRRLLRPLKRLLTR